MKVFIGEGIGTFVLTLFGCGSVTVAILFGEYSGIFQVGLIWGVAVTLAIYLTRYLSCAHLNPAVTLAMVLSKRMEANKLLPYMAAQLLGAFAAGLVLYLLFAPSITAYEAAHQIVVQRDAEARLAGVALTAGTAAQLIVNSARLVALRAQYEEPACFNDLFVL